jgi:uncharacterized MAPEG superfamily protein
MTTDLWMMVWAGVLSLLWPTVLLAGRLQVDGGFEWALGNRDSPLRFPAWVDRAERAHRNMVENLAPFAILVIAAHLSGGANGTTALGAQIYLGALVVHAAVYTAGIIGVRPAVFFAGAAGEVMILMQLF